MSNHKDVIIKRYNRISRIYDRMDKMVKEAWRIELLKQVSGEVLEVGVGTGVNLAYYPKGVSLTGVDFSPRMLELARKKVDRNQFRFEVQLLEADIQELPFQDHTFDYIVSTCVFCSVPDPVEGLKELKRVCKPSGKILMLEHMRSENPVLGFGMDLFNPISVSLWGANINRRTMKNIEASGLNVDSSELLMGTVMRKLTLSP
ncbi:SAM-dependent methyltransferase [Anaerobacillus arseniciselenatis]|uniref:SAM-dependent methyltransferase n=1 Tax=Anaerobacillus arseniciselenatis TaxID=85682 RepID=A0A1S2LHB8_9BACI|nr:class I SAM-dependent methyltransferase [Anaerobacillus arseniciselenatis]OIJ11620.1 SAM-dependent methyltransferase [Anaerobacillus arseniciselenatis]